MNQFKRGEFLIGVKAEWLAFLILVKVSKEVFQEISLAGEAETMKFQ
jgi:hypothetical protein